MQGPKLFIHWKDGAYVAFTPGFPGWASLRETELGAAHPSVEILPS